MTGFVSRSAPPDAGLFVSAVHNVLYAHVMYRAHGKGVGIGASVTSAGGLPARVPGEVHVYDGSEVSLKGDGGPTCLTAPLWRAGR
jgi:hypothetical protein